MNNRLRAVIGSCLAAAISGCQAWIDVDAPQCKLDEHCVALLGQGATCGQDGICNGASQLGMTVDNVRTLPGRWSCARDPAAASALDPSRSVRARMDVVDLMSLQVPPGLSGAACLADDADCTRPLIDKIAPGSDGFVELELPYNFQGYLSFKAPDYLPLLAYNARPYTEPTSIRGPPMVTPDALQSIAAVSGSSAGMSSRGTALFDVRDCNDRAGDGVSFDETGGKAAFYFKGAAPSPGLTQTAISNQLSAGREPRAMSGFTDLEPGPTTFRAVLPETGEVVSRVTVAIRAGHITYVRLRAGY